MPAPVVLAVSNTTAIDQNYPTDISNVSNDFDFYLENITISSSAAPSTAGDLVITLDSNSGANYDVALISIDPSQHPAVQDFVYTPDSPLLCVSGDQINISYTNTNGLTWGLRVVGISA